MLFIHGWIGSWRYWWTSMQYLASYNRAFAIDLWGFGDSMKSAELYHLQVYTELVGQFRESLGISQPLILVGHGLGAIVALRYAQQNPGQVLRLFTVALPLRGRDLDPRLAGAYSTSETGRLLDRISTHPELQAELHKMDRTALDRLSDELSTIDLSSALDELSCPLLMTHGAQDIVVRPPGESLGDLEGIASKRLSLQFSSAGHFPMLESPEPFNRLLLEYARVDWQGIGALAVKEHWRRRTH